MNKNLKKEDLMPAIKTELKESIQLDSDLDIESVGIRLTSPETILAWSHGEVLKPETINYRTQRPEKDGLFSERIFGPTKDYECYCGKYKKIRYKGVICDKCGVEVTRSVVRRERMGHITLAAPVAHIWFLKTTPSRLGLLLNISAFKLEKVIYYISYIVTKVNEINRERALKDFQREVKLIRQTKKEVEETLKDIESRTRDFLISLKPGLILNEQEYFYFTERFGDVFEAERGAGAIRKILENLDLPALAKSLEKELSSVTDAARKVKILRRLKLVKSLIKTKLRPEWMILTVLPVLPPELRPMVALDGGRYATADLNDLYRRVINRNNRLKKLIELRSPEVIITNEKRMLQEAVDALIDNSARFGVQLMASNKRRPLRSLADMLKGKQGRFRQNLLGKRVDYSGRSVIVVGPELRLNECGLPKNMALEIFRPFVINKIIEQGLAYNIKNANRFIDQAPPEVWEILEKITADKKILLNRAPTLHRLGIQAFKPVLIEDLAIRIPPMVCTAFNADFDGDQMAVHLPLTAEAQYEAKTLMDAGKNLLKPANGEPITSPSQDIVLGCYFLTRIKPGAKGEGMILSDLREAIQAFENNLIDINAQIKIYDLNNRSFIETSYGRLIFNQIFPEDFGFINETLNKKALSKIVAKVIDYYGVEEAYRYLDEIKNLGFHYATLSGITWGMSDMIIPPEKKSLVEAAEKELQTINSYYEEGLLTDTERKDKTIALWNKVREDITKLVPQTLTPNNPIYTIIDSGARGSWKQPVQMMGMKGLVIDPKNKTIELPIKSSYKEGLSVFEYFIAIHGGRKGSIDTALKTATAGYLTRRLIDVAQDLIVIEKDCRTKEGIEIRRREGEQYNYPFEERLYSRTALEDIKVGNKLLVKAGEIIDRRKAQEIKNSPIESVKVRSPIACKTLYGICSLCYGLDLGRNKPVEIGEAVGIIAAQSIGEPGTQLTLRTFHVGGIAGMDITQGLPRVEEIFEARSPKGKTPIVTQDGEVIKIENHGPVKIIKIRSVSGKKKEIITDYLVSAATLFVKEGDHVKKGSVLSEGSLDLREILKYQGMEALEHYIINEIQKIYIPEGTSINDKHIEIIIRQMLSRLLISKAGDTDFLAGDLVEKSTFIRVNREIKKAGKQPAKAIQKVMGISRVAITTESFLSAASFQETVRVLVNASLEGRVDYLRGLKENVIIGKLIPAGTGLRGIPEEFLK